MPYPVSTRHSPPWRRRFEFASLTLFGVLAVNAAPLRADPCDRLPPPSVTLSRSDDAYAINNAYDHKSLASLAAALARPGFQVLGLTRGNATVRFQVDIPLYTDRSGRWECASPQLIVSYGYSPMTVYVAREFAPATCSYREVLAHEMRHVDTYRRHLLEIEPELDEALQRRFATTTPWRAPLRQTRAMLERELQERWLPFIESAMRRVEEAQAAIDSPDEYERAARRCGGEIGRLLRQRGG